MLPFLRFSLALFSLFLEGCHSSRQTLSVHALPNYEPNAVHQIVFLDFTISRSALGKPEQLTLVNSIAGVGELKNVATPVHTPYQIKLVRYYTDDRLPEQDSLEHPLIRSLEIADTDGTLTRKPTSDLSGQFSVRFPYSAGLRRIELYSVTPDRGTLKIHTLHIKP